MENGSPYIAFQNPSLISGPVLVAWNLKWHLDLPQWQMWQRSAAWSLWLSLILLSLWNLDQCVGKWTPRKGWMATVLSLASFTAVNTTIFPKYYPCHILLWRCFAFAHSLLMLIFLSLSSFRSTCLLQFAAAGLAAGTGLWSNLKLFFEKGDRQFWFIESDLVLNGVQLQAALSYFGFISCFAHCMCVCTSLQAQIPS